MIMCQSARVHWQSDVNVSKGQPEWYNPGYGTSLVKRMAVKVTINRVMSDLVIEMYITISWPKAGKRVGVLFQLLAIFELK